MLLYMRGQVEKFAIDKWGSLENLDKEFLLRGEKKAELKRKRRIRSINGACIHGKFKIPMTKSQDRTSQEN